VKGDYWCRNCNHVVKVRRGKVCVLCGSRNTGMAYKLGDLILRPDENSGRGKTHEEQHDTMRQTKYPYTYRLARGFAIMNGGQI
jgi:hypothetical protein